MTAALIGAQSARMPSREMALWNQIRPGIVTLTANGRSTGVAALLDDSGYFVAQSSTIGKSPIIGYAPSGKQIVFNVVAQDKASMLVLLKTNNWEPGTARPFRAPSVGEEPNGELIAVLPTGPVRMTYGARHKIGLMKSSRRLVPLTEVRFESAPQIVGGALIFSDTGDLIGSINATLGRPDENNQRQPGGSRAVDNFGTPINSRQQQNPVVQRQYISPGPSDMTVAYTVSSDFVHHVLEGFLSPSHTVEFAALGIFCTDAVGGGALIQQVSPDTPAERVGLLSGDVILNIDTNPIADQVAFATVMLQEKVGKKIPLVVQRGQRKILIEIIPGRSAE